MPGYAQQLGFAPGSAAFSTSVKGQVGLCLVDVNNPTRVYQHPSWKREGALGPLAIDELGNVYLAPVPNINVLDAVRGNQYRIYKVDAITQEMSVFYESPTKNDSSFASRNAYGFMGLYYDCKDKLLYASSVQGSSITKEAGTIYCIVTSGGKGKLVSSIPNTDAIGIGVVILGTTKYLLYGHARTSKVMMRKINAGSKRFGPAQTAFSLEGIGKNGDDVAKKIRCTNAKLLVTGIPFYFNLTAPTQSQEVKYECTYDAAAKKWIIKLAS
jgi:hypothetical protein